MAMGAPGDGTRALVQPLLAANGLNGLNAELLPLGDLAALHALQAGEADAAVFSGPAQAPGVWQALSDERLKLASFARADACPRRFPHLTRLTLVVVVVPLVNLLPQLLRWRVRSRLYRLYGELALLEREVAARVDAPPTATRWLAQLDRIERAAAHVRTSLRFASERDTLREHIVLVRRAVLDKARQSAAAEAGERPAWRRRPRVRVGPAMLAPDAPGAGAAEPPA